MCFFLEFNRIGNIIIFYLLSLTFENNDDNIYQTFLATGKLHTVSPLQEFHQFEYIHLLLHTFLYAIQF